MSSFQDIINEHNADMAVLNASADVSREQFSVAVDTLTSSTLSDISVVSKKTYNTQKEIEKQALELHEHTQKVMAQSKDWSASLKDFNNAIKELGDVSNWTKVIESDMTFIAKALDNTVAVTHKNSTK